MALITQGYIREQALLHEQAAYGTRGFNWGYLIAGIALVEQCKTILDYGCGKGTLVRTLRDEGLLKATGYDPAVPEFASEPQPADLVASVDVMEHIEPDCLEDVLAHLARLTRKALFVAISTRPAKRFLSDGCNTHLIVEDGAGWWRPRFERHGFQVRRVWSTGIPEWVALMKAPRR